MKVMRITTAIGIIAAICCLMAIECVGEWDEVPVEMKTHIDMLYFDGRMESRMSVLAGTEEAYGTFGIGGATAEFCDTYCWPGYEHVWVHFYALSGGTGSFWAPWLISFTQGRRQYDVGVFGIELKEGLSEFEVLLGQPWDYVAIDGPFGGGSLKPGISC